MESLPVSPELLDRAIWWYDISWYGLIVAAFVTAIGAVATVVLKFRSGGVLDRHTAWRTAYGLIVAASAVAIGAVATVAITFLQFWSGGVLDRHTAWRTATLELQTARANEHTAELERDIVSARSILQRELRARIILESRLGPRIVRDEQALIDALRGFAGRRVSVFAYQADRESAALAAQIMKCFGVSGLIVDDQTDSRAQLSAFVTGILVGGPDEGFVKLVAGALGSVGLGVSIGARPPGGLDTLEPSDASVFVGTKSTPLISPSGPMRIP